MRPHWSTGPTPARTEPDQRAEREHTNQRRRARASRPERPSFVRRHSQPEHHPVVAKLRAPVLTKNGTWGPTGYHQSRGLEPKVRQTRTTGQLRSIETPLRSDRVAARFGAEQVRPREQNGWVSAVTIMLRDIPIPGSPE